MKVRISYFYQIRNFKQNMIPMSTAMSDPSWFHDFKDQDYIFTDKRGILNGLRLKPVIVQGGGEHHCPCEAKDPSQCPLTASYEAALEQIDFPAMMRGIESFCTDYCKQNNINEEPIAVLIVYEAPDNPCSERHSLIKYFNNHGVECKELDYPINNPATIKQASFEF